VFTATSLAPLSTSGSQRPFVAAPMQDVFVVTAHGAR
jgi:hypothetical protein